MSKRIAIVANTAWNLYNFRRGLIRSLQDQGHTILAIAPHDEYGPKLQAELGCRFVPLQQLSRKGTNPIKDYRLYRELRQIFQQEQIELVLLYTIKPNIYGTWAASSLGIPALCTVTGLGYSFIQQGWVHRLVKWLYRTAFRKAERVFFQNEDDLQLFLDLQLVPAAKAGLVPGSGIDLSHFQALPLPSQPPFVFLFVGRMLYDKGLAELLQAAAQLQTWHKEGKIPTYELWLVGGIDQDNPAAVPAELIENAVTAGQVRFFGHQSDVRPFLAQAHVIVLPSYREGLPRVMLEGMAMARPLLTTQAPGCRATVQEGENGLLVPIKNAGALALAMLQLANLSPNALQNMGQKGRQLAQTQFSIEAVVAHYQQAIIALENAERPKSGHFR